MRKERRRLLTGLLCMVLLVSNITSVGIQAQAGELEVGQTSSGQEDVFESEDNEEADSENEELDEKDEEADSKKNESNTGDVDSDEAESLEETEDSEQPETDDAYPYETDDFNEEADNESEDLNKEEKSQMLESMDAPESQIVIVEDELEGVYQFGDAPSMADRVSNFSMHTASYTEADVEVYLYQQMKVRNPSIDVQKYNIELEDMGNFVILVSSVLNEHPDLYFVNKGFSYSCIGTKIINLIFTYDNTLDDVAFQREVASAMAVVDAEMSNLEKAIVLHDYLAVNCEYDKENYDKNSIPSTSYSTYGVFVNRTAVCEGYALAYKYLLNQMGIECYMVTSKGINHAWNLIKLDNQYYQVDVTWDDPDLVGLARHIYMFCSDSDFRASHSEGGIADNYDGIVTSGSNGVDYKATDIRYDNAFWRDGISPLVPNGDDCYYVSSVDRTLKKTTLSDITNAGEKICNVGSWGYWNGAFSGLFQIDSRLYYNDSSCIYSIDLDGNNQKTIFRADTTDGYIFGSAYCQGKILYSLHQNPNLTEKETALEADNSVSVPHITVTKIKTAYECGGIIDVDDLTVTYYDEEGESSVVTDYKTNVEDIDMSTPGRKTLVITYKGMTTVVEIFVGAVYTVTFTGTGKDDITEGTPAEVKEGTDYTFTLMMADGYIYTVTVVMGEEFITPQTDGNTYMIPKVTADLKITIEKTENDIIASGTYTENGSDISWVIDTNGKLTVEGTGNYEVYNDYAVWYSWRSDIRSAEINVTGITSTAQMFSGCNNLVNVDLTRLDTSSVENMTSMFYGCNSLTELNLSGLDTSSVKTMYCMFYGCNSLTKLNLSELDTSSVENMNYMFYGCNSLTELNLGGLDTSSVKNMTYMFFGCNSLTELNLSGLDTSSVENMTSMFYWCNSLTELDLSSFNVSRVASTDGMFYGCTSLTKIRTPYNLKEPTPLPIEPGEIWNRSDGVEALDLPLNLGKSIEIFRCKKIIVSGEDIASGSYGNINWTIDEYGKLTVEGTGDFSALDYHDYYNRVPWSNYRTFIKSAEINVTGMTDARYMFYGCENLTNCDLSKFHTEDVQDMGYMFYGCKNLLSLVLRNFDTQNVQDMSSMFSGCRGLISLDVGSFDTSRVTDMSSMFSSCGSLSDLDVSGFDTSRVTDMSSMFGGYSGLNGLDVSSFDTGNVTDMSGMFCGCKLTSLNLSNFDTSNVTNMSIMFKSSNNLTSLDLSGFDTSSVIWMNDMFRECFKLPSLDLSSFDTSKVTSMSFMFQNCSSLISVDLSSFDTSKVAYMGYMFYNCNSLISVDLSSFDTSKVTSMGFMFQYCNSLSTIYTPYNLHLFVDLPIATSTDTWYKPDGAAITELPQDLNNSIVVAKNKIPEALSPHISAVKIRTAYECGETINTDDITVKYYDISGVISKVTEGFTTNAAEIDMSTPGKKILKITYNGMTTEVEIFVGAVYTVTFTGTGKADISVETPKKAREGIDYTFTLMEEVGFTYIVTATMGEELITLSADETGNTYTIPNVTANIVITIEKNDDTTGLKIKFVHEEDKESTYTGKAIQPEIKVTYNGKSLTAGVDYTIKYANNTNVGTAQIKITGKGNFGKANSQTTFQIAAKNIGNQDVTLCGASAGADGKELLTFANAAKLTPILYYNNIKLTSKDYVVKDASGNVITNKKLADSDNSTTVRIEAKSGGNFTGSRDVTLNVVDKKNLMKFTVAVDKKKINTLIYDGKEHYIHEISGALTVTAKNTDKTPMEYEKDYTIVYQNDLTSAGTKKFTVVGLGLYTGSISKSYTIKPAKEATLKVFFDGKDVTGDKISEIFTFVSTGITFNSRLAVKGSSDAALTKGKDYMISYSGNKKANQNAKCTITFLGNYKGHTKLTVSFEIGKADLGATDVIIADQLYRNKAGIYKSTPYVIADKKGANSLVSASNYKVTYYTENPANNAGAPQMKGSNKVGDGATVWVKLEAKGKNYSGEKIVSYKVRSAQDLSKAKITFQDADGNTVKSMPYTGRQITSAQIKTVVEVGGKPADGADIEVIYINNINKGKATVIVKGTDTDDCKYVGCKKTTFSIVARGLDILNLLF